MKLMLDKAAFDAGQTGHAIVVGRLRRDVIETLRSWSVGNRAATVELAPVSFVLRGG